MARAMTISPKRPPWLVAPGHRETQQRSRAAGGRTRSPRLEAGADAALRHGHSARGRDHGADGLTYRGDCGPRSTQGSSSQSDPRFNPRADDGAGATRREPDRCSVIAALAIVAYVKHLYCRSARAEARAIVASRSRSAKSRRLRGDVPRSRTGRAPVVSRRGSGLEQTLGLRGPAVARAPAAV